MPTPALSYKIAVLVFLENAAGEHLLMLRAKPPNLGVWSPIGGKLETALGESPFECAVRETAEETGHVITAGDLHLFAMIAEKAYEGQSHWLMFLFRCKLPIAAVPPDIAEGKFGFFPGPRSIPFRCLKRIVTPSGPSTTATATASSPSRPTAPPASPSPSRSRKSRPPCPAGFRRPKGCCAPAFGHSLPPESYRVN